MITINFPKNSSYIELYPKSKRPRKSDWPNRGCAIEDIERLGSIPADLKFGILTGAASGGLIDIDLDGPFTIEAGAMILPSTGLVMGRDSRPASHWFYRIEGDARSVKVVHPVHGMTLVEFRGDGCQTMMAGSEHPDGELVRFEAGKDQEPSWVSRQDLLKAVRQIATVSVLSGLWNPLGRHNLSLWFAGLCACNGVSQEACETVIRTVCAIAGDEEGDDRLEAVATTYQRVSDRRPVEWRSKLTDLFGSEKTVLTLIEWMGGRRPAVKAVAKANDAPTISMTVDFNTDISTAEAFCGWISDRFIYAEHEGRFYENRADVYDPVSSVAVKARIMEFLKVPANAGNVSDPAKVRASQSSTRINAVYELSKALMRKDDRDFNRHSHLIGTQNGVLDLSKRELVATTDIVTRRIGTEFHPHAWCPKFKAFLGQVLNGDNEKIEYVRRAIGYTLTGSVEAQVMFILIGSGANGKSVFLNLLQALMGDYGTSLPPHSIMQPKFSNDKTDDLASLDGKRFVFATEGEAGDKLAVAKIKRMTGGDMMLVKRLYKDYFNLKPEFKLWFASNDLPQISGNDDAIWRRIHVINFPVTFKPEERDPKLLETLKGELPGILNWALEGLRQIGELKGDFLAPPESVRHSIAQYRSDNDNVSDFIEGACVRDPNERVMVGDLYNSYVNYCQNSGSEPQSNITFAKSLNRLGFGIHKLSKGNARTGLRLK